jgi:hypothetical protein
MAMQFDHADSVHTYAADVALTVTSAEAWSSLAAIAGTLLAALSGLGGIAWVVATSL